MELDWNSGTCLFILETSKVTNETVHIKKCFLLYENDYAVCLTIWLFSYKHYIEITNTRDKNLKTKFFTQGVFS